MEPSVPLHKANANFCLAFLQKLSENDKTANIIFSPFSISAGMAMVMLGAKGHTEAQMSEVLRFTEKEEESGLVKEEPMPTDTCSRPPLYQTRRQAHMQQQQQQQHCRLPTYLLKVLKTQTDQDDVHAKFAELLTELCNPDAPHALSLANKLYGEQSYEFLSEFLDKSKNQYGAELEKVDFLSNAEEARININSWVEKQTHDKIKNLLKDDAVDTSTKLVLVNAIYFKGKWDEQFRKEDTGEGQFKVNKNETKPVLMMHQDGNFKIHSGTEINVTVLEMTYEEKLFSMIIILPDEIEDDTTGLEKLEKELTMEKFTKWTSPDMMEKTEVKVSLPRFKMEETYDLKDVLTSMGMTDAFDATKSDFSGMSPVNDLVLSKVVHKAFVEVNEEGTEAAAATAAVMVERVSIVSTQFNADHAFLFFIRHNPTNTLLFAGRLCSPE